MRKMCLFLWLAGFAVALVQADESRADREREQLILEINYVLEQSTVLEYLKKCAAEIAKENKDGKTLSARKYSSYLARLDMYSQNRWFVADTGLSAAWFADVRKLLKYLYETGDIIETAIHNHQTETAKYKQAAEYFAVAGSRFAELVKNPVQVSDKVRQQAERQKLLWQKAMREKYKINP